MIHLFDRFSASIFSDRLLWVERGVKWVCNLNLNCHQKKPPWLNTLTDFMFLHFYLFVLSYKVCGTLYLSLYSSSVHWSIEQLSNNCQMWRVTCTSALCWEITPTVSTVACLSLHSHLSCGLTANLGLSENSFACSQQACAVPFTSHKSQILRWWGM